MELLILVHGTDTHANVVPASEARTVPPGARARVIGPSDWHLGLPYAEWHRHLGGSVDLRTLPAQEYQHARYTGAAETETESNIGIGAMLDGGFQLIRRGSLPVVALAAVLQLPQAVLPTVMEGASTSELTLFVLASFAWYYLSQGLLIAVFSQAYHGSTPNLLQALGTVSRRCAAVVGAGLLVILFVTIGMFLFVVPGFILLCRYYAVTAVVVLEDRGPWSALGRSNALARGAGWSIFATVGTIQIIAHLMGYAMKNLQSASALPSSVIATASFAASTFLLVLSAAVVTALYYALRVEKEGYDLQLLTERLDGGKPALASA